MATAETAPATDITDPAFWDRPLADRMTGFAALRAGQQRFPAFDLANPVDPGETPTRFHAVVHYDDVVEISRDPKRFCSGEGTTAIFDLIQEAREYFGSFIVMDDPRHARQRGIVSRSFTPRRLAGVLDSVEHIADEVIDEICEDGEADLVEAISAPFPLLVICDMMGIPRSEFRTVYHATNTILGAGDPDFMGGKDPLTAILDAGATLTGLMDEVAAKRRSEPTDDLTSALVHADVGEEMMTSEELGPFFILLAVAGNDTTRTATSLGMNFLDLYPDQRAIWADDIDGVTPTAVDEIVRFASPVVFMRRTVTEPVEVSGQHFVEGDKVVLFYGSANRDETIFDDPDRFDVRRDPNPHIGFGGPGPHFCLGAHLARRELSVMFRKLLTRLPDIETTAEPTFLDAQGIPLVSGVKRYPVRFTPTARVTS